MPFPKRNMRLVWALFFNNDIFVFLISGDQRDQRKKFFGFSFLQ